MSGYTTDAGKEYLLNQLATVGTHIGLAVELPVPTGTSDLLTLAEITEVTTTGYARAPITWSAATTSEPIQLVQNGAITFAAVTEDMADAAAYVFLCDAASGTTGTIYYIWSLLEPVQVLDGVSIFVPDKTAVVE